MGLRNKRPRKAVYSVNRKSNKSGKKIENAIKHFKKLQTRIAFEGQTLWLTNALEFSKTKLKKYSINIAKIS
jgi:hypothetical protein